MLSLPSHDTKIFLSIILVKVTHSLIIFHNFHKQSKTDKNCLKLLITLLLFCNCNFSLTVLEKDKLPQLKLVDKLLYMKIN